MFNPLSSPHLATQRFASRPEVKLARSRDELYQAFQLTYQSYFRAGLAADNPSGLRLTPYHLLPCSEVIISKTDSHVNSTLSLFGDGPLGLPMQSMYSREIETFRNQGLRLAEVGSLADRRAKPGRFLLTFAEMGRLIAQVASARKFDALVAVVHPKHARLYKRVLGFRQLGDHTDCPYANGNPAEALYLRFDDYLGTRLHDQFFCDPYPPQELHPYHWDEETRRFFRCILECDGKIAHAIGMEDYYSWGAKYPSAKLNVTAGLTSSTS